ncbi:YbaB/EbfC family nucleoid-associated protein [Desulfofundulus thermobenzoicus]|uniref:Nucleoid-associated protein GFC01_08300 n=2 Tax=Desulfofundulus thermobenzoicus TaxID=29376 RepID=A0A6N7IQS1_9FIRM|nr:YbaB/EbfC family nucleoid-associated protein [Desulfofundulus thermobenzoicus]HHW44637.1 YbaB/EbfC family nucleoid-associated protein [Desulfotomaculum sp.]
MYSMMGPNMNKMMKQVQKMQAEMMRMQEELGNRTVEATAGGGVVRAVANGKQELVSLEIKPEAVDPEDVEMLQDLILTAVNSALDQSREMVAAEMGKLTGGLNIPGLF